MKTRLLLLLLMTCYWSVNAQIPGGNPVNAQIPGEPLSVQGPNAASLGQYGEVPISLFTGLPGIEIPLYTVQEGNITVPVSLSYHASGFRPDVHPGWVGMGWNLSAGGAISRTVHRGPDEYNNAGRGGASGYYFSHGLLNKSDWFSEQTINSIAQLYGPDIRDAEPDEFSFNFGEYSGKFYLSADGNWKVKCNKPITVAPYSVAVNGQASYFLDCAIPLPPNHNYISYGASKTFAGFVVTTENGTQYVFGGTTTAIEYQVDLFDQLEREWVAGTWNLTQIIHPDGHRVDFAYERISAEYVSQMYYSLQGTLSLKVEDNSGKFLSPAPQYPCGDGSGISTPPSYFHSTSGKLIAPVYLTTIKSSLCTVAFGRTKSTQLRYHEGEVTDYQSAYQGHNPGGGAEWLSYLMRGSPYLNYPACMDRLQWQKLTGITVTTAATASRLPQLIKGFVFGYNDNSNERLTLLSVTEQGTSISSAKPPYRFGYNKSHNLPAYLLDQVDHWGFYNANYVAIDNPGSPDYTNYYSHREPTQDSAVYLMGMLTRIVYPTGGKTDFQYDQHKFGAQLNENRFVTPAVMSKPTTAGGVRIRKITSYSPDQPTQKLEKEYFYVTGYTPNASADALVNLPSSGVLGGRARYGWGDYRARSFDNTKAVFSRSLFSAQSVLPASSNSAGSHIGYSTVVEKRSDGSYTQYGYSNFTAGNGDPGHLDEPPLNQLQVEFTDPNINDTNRVLYGPYSSTEEERGKLLREEAFNNAGQRVRYKVIDYVAFNKSAEFVGAVNGSNFRPCSASSSSLFAEGASYKIYTYSYLPNKETETIYDPSGGNPVTTVKTRSYSPLGYKLVWFESLTDSKNQVLTTTYRYPFDLGFPANATPPAQPLGDPVASAMRAMTAKNMIGSPIETKITRNGLVTAASIQTYRLAGPPTNTSILPFQFFSLEASQPLSQYTYTTYGSQQNDRMILGGGIPQMQLKATFTQYDAKGNPLRLVKSGVTNADYTITGGTTSSYLWGYQNSLPLAKVENAIPAEIFHSSFEEDKVITTAAADAPGTWLSSTLKFEATPSDRPSPRNAAHTGQLAAAMYTTYQGDQGQAFGPTLTIPGRAKRFVFSGWVYSNGPAAQIWLFMNQSSARNADGTISYYDYSNNNLTPVNLSTNVTGQWVYLEQEVDVPANATLLTLRLTNFWNGAGNAAASVNGGGVWFDDVRIHPADAQMTTYTHAPLVGITSMSDANNHPVYYEYDELSRLWVVRDQNRNIVKHYQYHYQR